MRGIAIAALLLVGATQSLSGAHAEDTICEAVALRNVSPPGETDPLFVVKRGATTSVTVYVVDEKGVATFCQHGGSCYPAEAMRLTNCAVSKRNQSNDGTGYYALEPIRSRFPATQLREYDLDRKLIEEMGMCSACADNAAHLYVTKPSSKCGRLVKEALEGNPIAVKRLAANPDYCIAWK